MLRLLFPGLTAAPERGEALFAEVTAAARAPHWYTAGGVPDTLDGRFRMLTTLAALVIVRLEQGGTAGEAASVALTERFVQVMESEHRELGIGDPKLGRTVRKLVGSLARRTALWRAAVAGESRWDDATRDSLPAAAGPAAEALADFWSRLVQTPIEAIAEGRLG